MDYTNERALSAMIPLSPRAADITFNLSLTGDNGFNSMNGFSFPLFPFATLTQAVSRNPRALRVKVGQRVHMRIANANPDPHPIHLHG